MELNIGIFKLFILLTSVTFGSSLINERTDHDDATSIASLQVVPRNGQVILVGEDVIIDVFADITTTLWPPVIVRMTWNDATTLRGLIKEVPVFWNQTQRQLHNNSDDHFRLIAIRSGKTKFFFDVYDKKNNSFIGNYITCV